MNRLHLQYLLVSFCATALLAIGVQIFILNLLTKNNEALAGAALSAGWWMNLATAGVVAILAGRKAAANFIDPRIGKVAGTAVGVWVGVGAVFGEVAAALALRAAVPRGDTRPGLILVFGLISLIVSIIAASIAGRETAHPPEAEEE